MKHGSGNIGDFGMDTACLAGPLEAKLQAVRDAGFTQVMLWAHELAGHPGGPDAAVAAVRASGLKVTGLQALRDFEGLSGAAQRYKVDMAKSLLGLCAALGCRLLLVGASSWAQAGSDGAALARDLRKLAMLAIPMNIRVAYEARSDAHTVREFPQAWDVVCQADMPNLGLALDAFELLASHTPLAELELLDAQRIFVVQLADALGTRPAAADAGRGATADAPRVFPGEGLHGETLAALVRGLHALGYRGDYSFEVWGDDCRQMPPAEVARRAWRAAQWLGEDVLRRSVPLPNQIRLRR